MCPVGLRYLTKKVCIYTIVRAGWERFAFWSSASVPTYGGLAWFSWLEGPCSCCQECWRPIRQACGLPWWIWSCKHPLCCKYGTCHGKPQFSIWWMPFPCLYLWCLWMWHWDMPTTADVSRRKFFSLWELSLVLWVTALCLSEGWDMKPPQKWWARWQLLELQYSLAKYNQKGTLGALGFCMCCFFACFSTILFFIAKIPRFIST